MRRREDVTRDGVIVLGRGKEDAVGVADLPAEGLHDRRVRAAGLEIGIDEGKVLGVDVLHPHPGDEFVAELGGFTRRRRRQRKDW